MEMAHGSAEGTLHPLMNGPMSAISLARSQRGKKKRSTRQRSKEDALHEIALRKASATSYYKGKDSLWVKLVSAGDSGTGAPGGGTSLQVSR